VDTAVDTAAGGFQRGVSGHVFQVHGVFGDAMRYHSVEAAIMPKVTIEQKLPEFPE